MQKILSCVMDIGEQMLLCGAEIHRVEDSIERMCKAFGAKRIDVFSITSSLVVTISMEDGEQYTQTRRINGSGMDLERLHRLNHLSRQICENTMTLEEIQKEYKECMKIKGYPTWVICLSYAFVTAAFTAFFGGNVYEVLLSAILGLLISVVTHFSEKVDVNRVFVKFFCSFFVTAFAFCFMKFGWIADVDKVIIGNIMVLIPGIGFTNALRDLFVGDSIAGLLRTVEAILLALAISAGYFLFVWLLGGVF